MQTLLNKIFRRVRLSYQGRYASVPEPERWLFIVGCYNSGTTLLQSLLASHPCVGNMPGEGQWYTDQLVTPASLGFRRLWALRPELFSLTEHDTGGVDATRIKRQWGAHFNDPERAVLLEKSPPNAARTRWLNRHFAPAYFVGIIRNGFAAAHGMVKRGGVPLRQAAIQWSRSNRIMLDDFTHLERKMLVRYEDLVAQPGATMRSVLEFAGLETTAVDVDDRTWDIHGEIGPIRNRNDEAIQAMSDQDRQVVLDESKSMLEEFAYLPLDRPIG